MIERICLLLEALSVVICLHHLYGEKFRLDIYTVILFSMDMIIMTTIDYYGLPKIYSLVIYLIIILYCGIKFGFNWKELIINNILYMVLVGGIQIIIIICYGWCFNMLSLNRIAFWRKEAIVVSGGVLLVVWFLLPMLKVHKLSIYLQDKEKILIISLVFCIIFAFSCFVLYKVYNGLRIYQNLVLFISLFLFCILAGELGKYKIRSKEIETELKMHRLYADSFQGLIEDIRLRQHEFDNHISAIYSLHYTCDSYEELVKAQNEYSQDIIKENRYNKLLKAGNPLLIGFLYGNFKEIEKCEIEVTYKVCVNDLDIGVPIYKLVEILGNLIKNAIEAMKTLEVSKAIYVGLIEEEGSFEIEVRNKSIIIDYNKIESFFKKGYSKKGKNRGLGLYNVKKICDEYTLNIYCENRNIAEDNWLCFTINNKKETI